MIFTVKKKRIVWEFRQNKRIIKNPEVLKEYVGCNLEKECNSCVHRDKCLKIRIKRGFGQ